MQAQKPFDISSIHESMAKAVLKGEITMEDAASELYQANWTHYLDMEYTRNTLAPYIAKYAQKESETHDHA